MATEGQDQQQDQQQQAAPTGPAVAFETKDQYTAEVSKHISAALAPKLKALEAAQAELEALRPLAGKVEELQAKLEGGKRTAEDQWQKDREAMQRQQQALAQQLEQEQVAQQQLRQRWQGERAGTYLQALALKAGASPAAVEDIPTLFPMARVAVEEQDGRLAAALVDPDTRLPERDQVAAMKAWLKSKPHLMAPLPGGAGTGGAPPPAGTDPTANMTPAQLIRHGLRGGRG